MSCYVLQKNDLFGLYIKINELVSFVKNQVRFLTQLLYEIVHYLYEILLVVCLI